MSTERDPLTTTGPSVSNTAPSAPATAAAATYAKEQAAALTRLIQEGNASIRVLALLGGIAMTVTSAIGLCNRFLGLHWISAIVEFYTLVLGVGVVALEARSANVALLPRRYTDVWEGQIRKYALFLNFVSGRGGLYFVAGTLQLSQLSIADLVVGGYMALIGVAYIIIGKRTSHKLRALRKSALSEDTLRKKFALADSSHCGSLSFDQFKAMMSTQFGIEFSARELEASFCHMDSIHARDGRVTLEEFLEWWSSCEFDDASMAEFGLSV
ncbi:hypothetical protein HJC23_004928 [Cyclotella cryptica]|uniref:EF-hand domain-containing protein n=1 Tax=Cyclotella cryptica TaxID=29204 RepID=A0ABD3PT78_9STRA